MLMANLDTYKSKWIVIGYSKQDQLYKHEITVLKLLKNKLKNMRMLDIGVGGGRTTCNFAPLVRDYVGIDYSEEMIKVCNERFVKWLGKISFKLCDVRNMSIFKDGYFDFVLVSANGLDYISPKDRLKALQEIKRVGKRGGFLFISSHNLLSIDKLLIINFSLNPITTLRSIVTYLLLKCLNKSFKKLKNKGYAIINDGAHQFRLSTYYINPPEQVKQLKAIGFKNICIYSLETGQPIKESEWAITTDGLYHGLYYLCNI